MNMDQTQKELYRMLFKQVADNIEKMRPCDAWRLWETVEDTAGASHHKVKQILKAKNIPAFNAYIEYESLCLYRA